MSPCHHLPPPPPPLPGQVLNLPPQSLQQEIELTADLMELFMQHQIPADLLMAAPAPPSPSSNSSSSSSSLAGGGGGGVEAVRTNVRAIQVCESVCVCV